VLNRTIYGNVQRMESDKNMTLSLVDYADGVLKLSGQHEEMIVVRNGGDIERIDTMDLGFPIGLEENIEDFIAATHVNLSQGDGVVLYTDGITEAENMQGLQYGMDRLCDVVSQQWHLPAEAIRHAVIADLQTYIGEQTVYDDITLLICKQK
jgi:phosphoserine phosphatase RsbU/P